MANIFICYHRTERALAARLKERLGALGHEVFIDSEIPPGSPWAEEIEQALSTSDVVVVLLSKASINRKFVREEVRRAYQKGLSLFPVRVQFNEELPYELGALLNPIQHAVWSALKDDSTLIRHIQEHLDRVSEEHGAGGPEVHIGNPSPNGTALLTDNWLLQDAVACLHGYFSSTYTQGLDVDPAGPAHWVDLPAGGIQLEALVSLITEIVLRERLVVEEHFAHAWRAARCLAPVRTEGIIQPIDFRQLPKLQEVRQRELEMLCITPALRAMQSENERLWNESSSPVNSRSSAIIWGTAGYLARAHLHQMVYSGHPLRRRFLAQTVHHSQGWDAKAHLDEWFQQKRLRLFEAALPDGRESRGATFIVPPIAVQVIENCSQLEDVIPTALQLRREYAELRGWISTYQKAMEDEEPRALLKHKRDLEEVSTAMEHQLQDDSRFGSSRLELNVNWQGGAVSAAARASARSILSSLIFTRKGEKSVRKLLRLLGEEQSTAGLKALEYLREQSQSKKKADADSGRG